MSKLKTIESSKLNRVFPVKYAVSKNQEVNKILLEKEQTIVFLPRANYTKEIYDTFDELFSLFLSKLPSNPVKKNVSNIFNKGIIYFGTTASGRGDGIFSRIFIDKDKLNGVCLETKFLGINPHTGETDDIESCIYSAYFGLIRAAIIINEDDVYKNHDLHKLCATYIYQILMKVIGKGSLYNSTQRSITLAACIYLFYKYYLNKKHSEVISIIKKNYNQLFSEDDFNTITSKLNNINNYKNIKDIGKLIIDLDIYYENPNNIILGLLKTLGNSGFFNMISTLERLIAMIIIAKYPSDLFNRGCQITDRIHDSIEKIIIKYINNIKYEKSLFLSPG